MKVIGIEKVKDNIHRGSVSTVEDRNAQAIKSRIQAKQELKRIDNLEITDPDAYLKEINNKK